MELGEYTLGLLILAGTWGASLATAALVVARRLPTMGGVPRVLAFGLTATAALIAAHELPGVLGVLSRWTALIAAAAILVAVWRLVPQVPGGPRRDAPAPLAGSGPFSWALPAIAGAALAVWVAGQVSLALRHPLDDVDSLTFQLPNVGRWMQEGTLWPVNQFVPLQAHGNYPGNGDLVFLSAIQPFGSDAFARLVNLPFYVLAGLAVYALAVEIRAPRATAALAGLLFASLPVVIAPAFGGAKTDPLFYAAFGTGVLFVVRHLRTGLRADLVLAGLGLGLGLGTKWYGLTSVGVVLVAWAAATLAARRGTGAVLRGGGLLLGLCALGGGFWLLRNAVESGSPLFPQALPPVWDTPRDFVRECVGFSIADYADSPGVLGDYIYPALRDQLGVGGVALVLGWVAAAAGAITERSVAVWTLLGATAALALAYTVTPYTALGLEGRPEVAAANVRYLVPALMVAAALLAWSAGRFRRLRPVIEVLMLVGALDGIRRGFELPGRNLAMGAGGLVLIGAIGYGLLRLRPRFPERRHVAIAAAVGALVVFGVGYERQRAFSSDRYANADAAIQALEHGGRVGLAGVWSAGRAHAPVWPAFGPRVRNHVAYVGEFRDGLLNEYRDRASWQRAVERGRYDLVAVGRAGYPAECRPPGGQTDDDAWARAAGYRQVARTADLTVYRVR